MADAMKTAELTRSGLNLIQQALSIYDHNLELVVSNRQFQDMFDMPDHLVAPGTTFEATIRHLLGAGEYGPVEDPENFVRQRIETAKAFEPHYFERTRSNGRTIAIEGAPLPQGGWVAVYTDITETREHERLLRSRTDALPEELVTKAEELAHTNRSLRAANAALREAQTALRRMEARARLTAEMTPAHIAHIDRNRTYTYSNRRLSRILEGRPSDIIGMRIDQALGTEAFAQVKDAMERAFTGRDGIVEFTYPPTNRRVRAAFTPDFVGDEVRGVHILSIDVTQEVQDRVALNQSRKRELAAQLTSGLAHDFSNLLTVILGLQDRLSRQNLDPAAQDMVAGTRAAARRGGQLLNRLADISGPSQLQVGPVHMDALLRDFAVLANPAVPEDIALDLRAEGFAGPVLLDAGALNDQLINLTLNAADAIGDAPGRISVTARPIADSWIGITVRDTGPGFSPEALEHGIEPFYSTKGGEGSGLGLTMVYDQAKLMGGHLRLGNSPAGAQIELRLPLRYAPTQDHPRLVLLVDDNAEIRETVREQLIEAGHQVVEAASVAEACELAHLDGLGLVLSDLSLGQGTGPDLARWLSGEGLSLPVIFMTSRNPGDPLRREAEALAPVLSKPVARDVLHDALSGARKTCR